MASRQPDAGYCGASAKYRLTIFSVAGHVLMIPTQEAPDERSSRSGHVPNIDAPLNHWT